MHFGRTLWAGADGRYDVVLECPADEPADSDVPAGLLATAIAVVSDLLAEQRPQFAAAVARIARQAEAERLGVSTAAIAAAARRRGIPVRRIGSRSMLRLGYGCHQRLACAALTDLTSAVGVDIASDKALTKRLLAEAGIPVPEGGIARSPEQAVELLNLLAAPVVIKPVNGNHGAGVTPGVLTPAQAEAAYAVARRWPSSCDRRGVRARHRLSRAGDRRPGGRRGAAAAGLGDR